MANTAYNFAAIQDSLGIALSKSLLDKARRRHPLLGALRKSNWNKGAVRTEQDGNIFYAHRLTNDAVSAINVDSVGTDYAQEAPTGFGNILWDLDQDRVKFIESYFSQSVGFRKTEMDILAKAKGGNILEDKKNTFLQRFSDAIFQQIRGSQAESRRYLLGISGLWANNLTVGGYSMSANSWWQTRSKAGGSVSLTLPLLTSYRNLFQRKASPWGDSYKMDLCIASCNPASSGTDLYTAIENIFGAKQTVMNSQMTEFGFVNLVYQGTTFAQDEQAGPDTLEFYDTRAIHWNGDESPGMTEMQRLPTSTSYEMSLYARGCLSINDMQALARVTAILGVA